LKAAKIAVLILVAFGCGSKYDVLITNDGSADAHLHLHMSDNSGKWQLDVKPNSTIRLSLSSKMDAHLEVQLTDGSTVLDQRNVGYFESGFSVGRKASTCVRVNNLAIVSTECTHE